MPRASGRTRTVASARDPLAREQPDRPDAACLAFFADAASHFPLTSPCCRATRSAANRDGSVSRCFLHAPDEPGSQGVAVRPEDRKVGSAS